MSRSPFAPLTPEALATDRERRAAAEAEIARREDALAKAEARLAAAKAEVEALEGELAAARTQPDAEPG